jgi:hypothetical protein
MAAPNIVEVAELKGKTTTLAVTTSAAAVVNNPAGSGKVLKVVSLYVANIDGSNNADITVNHYSQDDLGGTATKLANTITVPADATLVVIDERAPIFLEEDRSIGALASANGDLEIVCSYAEFG